MQIWGVVFLLLNFIGADRRYETGSTIPMSSENGTVDTNETAEATISTGKKTIITGATIGPSVEREPFVQLAAPKPAIISCDNTTSNELVDRNIEFSSFVFYETPCKEDDEVVVKPLVIEIRPTNRVGSVVVISGTNDGKKEQSNLNYFEVKLRPKNSGDLLTCGTYPRPFSSSKRMKVSCKLHDQVISAVVVSPMKSIINASTQLIAITEIGVRSKEFTLGADGFYGCYKSFVGDKNMAKKEGESCDDVCYDGKYIFSSTRSAESCICSDKVPTKALETNSCLPLCGKVLCGGESKFGVYIAMAPQIYLVGCKDVTPDKGPDLEESMTPGKCIEECAFLDLPFAYLHNTKLCACQTKLLGNEVPMKSCDSTCPGDTTKSCGGTNASLVYTGYISEKGATSIIDVFRCQNDNFDESGWCISKCDTGFKGRLCVERAETGMPEDKVRSNRSKTKTTSLKSTTAILTKGSSTTKDTAKDINSKHSAMEDRSVTAAAADGDLSGMFFLLQVVGIALLVVIVVVAFIVLISKFGRSEEASEED